MVPALHAPFVRYRNPRKERIMRTCMQRLIRDQRGLTTAEYAVGTVAVAGLGGLLIKLLTSDAFKDLLWSIITSAFASIVT